MAVMSDGVELALRPVFLLRRCLAVHPFNADTSLSYPWMIVTLLAVCLPCLIRIYISVSYHEGDGIDSSFYSGLSMVQSLVIMSCCLSSTFGFIRNERRFEAIKQQLVKCDRFLKQLQYPVDYSKSYIKVYIWMFNIFLVTLAIYDTIRIKGTIWYIHRIIYYYLKAVAWLPDLLFIAILKIVAIQILEFRRDLKMKNAIALEQLAIVYDRLMAICYEVNDFFSLSLIINMCNYFIALTLNSYYAYFMIKKNYYSRTVAIISWIVFRLIGPFMVVEATEAVSKQCREFVEEIELLVIDNKNNHLLKNETLKNFIRMRRVFNFNAHRFFNINRQCYLSMVSMAVSYLVLMFQLTSINYYENL